MTEIKKDLKGRKLKEGEDQLKDGRYRFRYTDNFGNRKAVYSWKLVSTDKVPVGKKDDVCLREKVKEILKDLDDNISTLSASKKMTVDELMNKYLDIKVKISISTKNNYIHMYNKNVKPHIGKKKVVDIKKSDIRRLYAMFFEEKGFSVNTIQLYQNLLFPCFDLAVDDDIIRKNPCKGCMKDYVRGSVSSPRTPLSEKEQDILINFVKNDSFYSRWYTLIVCMLGTGLRIGEAIGLTWDEVDFENKCIRLEHQVIYKDKEIRKDEKSTIGFFVREPKYKSQRTIPIHDDIVKLLKSYRSEMYFISKTGISIDGVSNFIFLNSEGNLSTPGTINRAFHGIVNAYNKEEKENAMDENREPMLLPRFSAHTLRHTYCTRMAEKGIDPKVLQFIMGHKNIQVTMQVYNHVSEERVMNATSELPALVNL